MELSEKRLTHVLAIEADNKLLIRHNKELLTTISELKAKLSKHEKPKSVMRDGFYWKFNAVQNAWIAYKDDKLVKAAFKTIPSDLF